MDKESGPAECPYALLWVQQAPMMVGRTSDGCMQAAAVHSSSLILLILKWRKMQEGSTYRKDTQEAKAERALALTTKEAMKRGTDH